MEVKQEVKINENGSYTQKTTKHITKEDGWVDVDETFGNNHEQKNKFFKGKAVSFQYETNDPKITRPFTRIASAILFAISIILLVIAIIYEIYGMLFFGGMLLLTTVLFFINSQKEIDEIEKQLQYKKDDEEK